MTSHGNSRTSPRPIPERHSPQPAALPLPIQPCSGFLGNGKTVIRPIAFKPLGGRLSAGGERYGSTPALASRPPSHMTLYGSSSDVRESRWCGSPQPASLSALPTATIPAQLHHRHHSVIRESKKPDLFREIRTSGNPTREELWPCSYTPTNVFNTKLSCGAGEPAPAPSPADSGVSELERDAAHTSPRHTDNEQHEFSERVSRSVRTPRSLPLSTYQLSARAGEARDAELARVRRDRALLRQRLEDTEWSLCQRAGEISLLKTQLKEAQNEQTAKGHEYLQLKSDCRQLREALDRKDQEVTKLRAELCDKDKTVQRLQSDVERLTNDLMQNVTDLSKTKENSNKDIERLKAELKELRQELSDISLSGYEGIECGRTMRGIYDTCKNNEYHWTSTDSTLEDAEVQRLNGELPDACGEPCPASAVIERLRCELNTKETHFSNERRKWSEEKEKVLRYQKQLQLNYVQMFRRSRGLEAELDSLRLEQELCNKNVKNINKLGKTIEL